tara:strand:- start:193 stop:510 length:318 start_codon:yes stop_codon:yes gene_type:complete
MSNQISESRAELKKRLKEKIKSKSTNRTGGISRKKGEQMNNSIKKISEILTNSNVESVDQIDSTLIETIMTAISKNDLELILNKMQENSKFKDLLTNIKDKMGTD